MCGGKVGDAFDSGTESLSNIDPTTEEGLTNLGLGGVVGGLLDPASALSGEDEEDAIKEAAAEAAAAQQEIAQVYRDQLAAFQEMTAPYREAGESFLPEFKNLLSTSGREKFMANALQSKEFQNIAGAATDQMISQSAALGNRLSSGIQEDVLGATGNLATQYASGAYNDRLNQLGQGVNIGLGTLGGSLSALQSSTAGQAGALGNIANINLQAANQIAAQPNMLGGLLGAGAGFLVGGPAGAGIGYNVGSNV